MHFRHPNFSFGYDIGKIARDWLTNKKLVFDCLSEMSNTFKHTLAQKDVFIFIQLKYATFVLRVNCAQSVIVHDSYELYV